MSSRRPPSKRLRSLYKKLVPEEAELEEEADPEEPEEIEVGAEMTLLEKQIAELEEKKEALEQDLADSMVTCAEVDKNIEKVQNDAREFDKNGWKKLRETFSEKQVRQLKNKAMKTSRDGASSVVPPVHGYTDDDKAIAWTIQNLMINRRAYDYIRQYMNISCPARARVSAWRAKKNEKKPKKEVPKQHPGSDKE